MLADLPWLSPKTISAGLNIIKDTKDYQNKEWSEEKKKINKTKDKITSENEGIYFDEKDNFSDNPGTSKRKI